MTGTTKQCINMEKKNDEYQTELGTNHFTEV